MAKADEVASLREKLGVTQPEDLEWLNLLVYGDPGAGKTLFASTAQDNEATRPVLFIDIDGGLVTIRDRKDIDKKKIRSVKALEDLLNMIFLDTTGYYKTIVLDSLTELQKLDVRDIMEEQYNRKPETTDKDVPSQREWGKSNMHITRIVRFVRDLPCHTIFTCQTHYIHDDTTGVTEIHPALPGKQRGEIPGYLDVVGYLNVQNVNNELTRRMQFAKTRRVHVKDRTQKLGEFVDNPTVPLLWEMITSEKEAA